MSHIARVRHHVVTTNVDGDKYVLKIARRAAGAAGCENGSRPGELIIYGSKVDRVLQALRDADIDVIVEAQR